MMARWWPAWASVPVVAVETRRHGGIRYWTLRLYAVAVTIEHRSRKP
jgi:hypothetical protein